MIVRVFLRHRRELDKTGKLKVAHVDIWGCVDPMEVSRIQQYPSVHRGAILDAYVEAMIKGKIPHTYANYEYFNWEFLDHSEADINERIAKSVITKRAKADEDAKTLRGNLFQVASTLHRDPIR